MAYARRIPCLLFPHDTPPHPSTPTERHRHVPSDMIHSPNLQKMQTNPYHHRTHLIFLYIPVCSVWALRPYVRISLSLTLCLPRHCHSHFPPPCCRVDITTHRDHNPPLPLRTQKSLSYTDRPPLEPHALSTRMAEQERRLPEEPGSKLVLADDRCLGQWVSSPDFRLCSSRCLTLSSCLVFVLSRISAQAVL